MTSLLGEHARHASCRGVWYLLIRTGIAPVVALGRTRSSSAGRARGGGAGGVLGPFA